VEPLGVEGQHTPPRRRVVDDAALGNHFMIPAFPGGSEASCDIYLQTPDGLESGQENHDASQQARTFLANYAPSPPSPICLHMSRSGCTNDELVDQLQLYRGNEAAWKCPCKVGCKPKSTSCAHVKSSRNGPEEARR
jgi:hypothetical protein